MTDVTIDAFASAYLETALWSSTDESTPQGGEPLDANYTIADIHPDTIKAMLADCDDFLASFGPMVEGREEQAGHDFWLTRNGHGAGFWDGDWDDAHPEGTVGDFLAAMSRPYGQFNLYVGDDSMIHGS